MRWIRFERDGQQALGYLRDGETVQPVEASRLQQVIGGQGVRARGDAIPRASVRILAPLRPGKIICVGLNYMDHCREQKIDPPDRPTLFAKFPTSVIGPGDDIRWPEDFSGQVDYEAELAVVIGRTAQRVSEGDALDAVFGFTIANDVSARDVQFSDKQWIRGKAADTFCPLGPSVVTRDEVADPQALSICCRVNGVTLQDSNTREMIFPVRQIVAFISRAITLEPGDVILTGTPDGVGVFRDPKVFLKPGDSVEVEIGDFGVLSNPVGAYVTA
jgi:2-keto-4-pentenoate hydratase/2-oxohepta-3-ene-1,7-dioic acid hydratase in catechol pathway